MLFAEAVGGLLSQQPRERELAQLRLVTEQASEKYVSDSKDDATAQLVLGLVGGLLRGFEAGQGSRADQAVAKTLRLRVLSYLMDGPRTPSQLADATGSPPSVIARILKALRESGAIEQVPTGELEDKRTRQHQLTNDGKRQLAASGLLAGTPESRRPPESDTSTERAAFTSHKLAASSIVALAQSIRRTSGTSQVVVDRLVDSLNLASDDRDRAEILGEIIVQLRSSGRPEDQEQVTGFIDELRLLAERNDPVIAARVHYELARFMIEGGAPEAGTTIDGELWAAESFAEQVHEPAGVSRLAWCSYTRGLLASRDGELTAAEGYAQRASKYFASLDDCYGQTVALILAGRSQTSLGDYASARGTLETAVEVARRGNLEQQLGAATYWLGEVELACEPKSAAAEMSQAVASYTPERNMSWYLLARSGKTCADALTPTSKGRTKSIEADLQELRNYVAIMQTDDWRSALVLRRVGTLERDRGDRERALDCLKLAARAYASMGDPLGQAASLSSLAQAQNLAGSSGHTVDKHTALQTATQAVDLLDAHLNEWLPALAQRPDAVTHVVWCLTACAKLAKARKGTGDLQQKIERLEARVSGFRHAQLPDLNTEIVALPRLRRVSTATAASGTRAPTGARQARALAAS
jgi:tetratricopeptide (TPR) repeat protein/DNA-binding transcriptional ArsR family regulator